MIFGLIPHTGLLIKTLTKIKTFFKNDLKLFLFIWFAFVFVFFSFSNTKLPHYIIYGYTPLFILIAITFGEYINQEKKRCFITLYLPILFFLFLFLSLPYLLQIIPLEDKFVASIKEEIINVLGLSYQLKLISLIILTFIIYKLKVIEIKNKLISISFIFIISINYVIIPVIAKVQQEPIKNIAQYTKKENISINMYKMNNPSFNLYSQSLVKKENPKSGDFVMTKKIYLKDFREYKIVYEQMGIVLIKVK